MHPAKLACPFAKHRLHEIGKVRTRRFRQHRSAKLPDQRKCCGNKLALRRIFHTLCRSQRIEWRQHPCSGHRTRFANQAHTHRQRQLVIAILHQVLIEFALVACAIVSAQILIAQQPCRA